MVIDMDALTSLLTVFKSERKAKLKLFIFWKEYIAMVMILLQFINGECTGNWNLHLPSTVAMIPHFFAMDRTNYAYWMAIYLADMHRLEERHHVFKEFSARNHSIGRSQQSFAQVWTDMTLEQ